MKKKQILALLVAAALVLGLFAGCGGGGESSTDGCGGLLGEYP